VKRVRIFALSLLLLVGCGRCGGTRATRDAAVARPQGRLGTVYGTVVLAQGATLPRWTMEQVGRAAGAPTLPPECSPPKDDDTLPVRQMAHGLDGIVITATGEREPFFAALPPRVPAEIRVAIKDCRLEPHVLVAAIGDSLVLENQTDEPFLPSVGPSAVLETLLHRQTRSVSLEHGGLTAIECRFAHGCGRAELLVMPNPVATVSREGRFELQIPSHMPITIHAWHPLFAEAQVETRVTTGQRREIRITITPAAPRAPRPPAPPPAPRDPNAPVID
jgi:hypothetical protein